MSWIKYAVFFAAVFAVFMFIAVYALLHPPGHSAGFVGYWMNYDDFSMPQFVVSKTSAGYWRENKLHQVKGHWTNKAFYSPSPDDPSQEVIVAKELPDEDLEVYLKYFDPSDPRTVTLVKSLRMPDEYHPYPVGVPGQKESYPPPKGMIKPGMLEADLHALPWQPYTNEEPQYVMEEQIVTGSYHGSTFTNAWPHVWVYKSDDPSLPELRVTTERGRVTQVVGGAEDAPGPSYFPPPDTTTSSTDDTNESWGQWLFDLLFRK